MPVSFFILFMKWYKIYKKNPARYEGPIFNNYCKSIVLQ
ncbi:hypothetical protein HMPREF1250_1445 [Megasphaera vaginalis (ex Srinivasan et al. 2021)]|uniref:Uncharacterized protein n=1 Tax=Megasphaera vaginalis (ex Srinivasan et al. 2021) TaxID=1111454 RepID=U7UIM1_9FIRM|nr:hypothetical protein HMPREF1250_1445 [Megasphaera vaginalis (ex Srinivasan et al. 2021)]